MIPVIPTTPAMGGGKGSGRGSGGGRPKLLAHGRKCDLWLETSQWEECVRRARGRGISVSEYLRLLIDFALKEEDRYRRTAAQQAQRLTAPTGESAESRRDS